MGKVYFDPEKLPVSGYAGGDAVPAERLTPEWIRKRFSDPPEWEPAVLAETMFVRRDRFIPAAVLVPLVVREGEPLSLFLTQRALHLHDHPGQISFPGGRVDLADSTRIETALRELEEETGISRSRVDIIGTLPEYRTGSGYRVTPVVSFVRPPFEVRINPEEVADAFEIPFSHFMDGSHYQIRETDLPKGFGKRSFFTIPWKNRFVWGATAAMLRNLYLFMRA